MQGDVYKVITRRIVAGHQVIQIKGEVRELPQVQRVEEVRPLRGIDDVAVAGDKNVVEMERIVERLAEQDQSGQSQTNREFQPGRVVTRCHAIVRQQIGRAT